MGNTAKKNESPACACGRGDLYEGFLIQNENKQKEAPAPKGQAGKQLSSSDAATSGNTKPVKTKKAK